MEVEIKKMKSILITTQGFGRIIRTGQVDCVPFWYVETFSGRRFMVTPRAILGEITMN